MADKMIKLSRRRAGEYTVNYDMNGRIVVYRWAGSVGNRIDTKAVPDYVVDWLIMNTTAISNGNLVIEKDEDSKEIIDNIAYEDSFGDSTHTREEIEKLLKGNTNTMKARLNKIDNPLEKDFIATVAQEMKIDSVGKRSFLAEWMGISVDMLFDEEDE